MENSKVSPFTKLYSIIIILLPFLYQYASPFSFLSLGDFVLLFFTGYGLLKLNYGRAMKYIRPIIVFSVSFCILTFFVSFFSLNYFRYGDAFTIFLKILLYGSTCAVCTQYFDLKYVKKIYFALVWIFAAYLVIQVIYHELSGGFLPIYLKHDWLFSWEKRPANLVDYYVTGGYYRFRPSSLFLEPGYYALYVLPALFLLLFEEKKLIKPILLYCTILLSTSGAGVLIGLLAFAVKGLGKVFYFKDGRLYVTLYAAVALTVVTAGVIVVLLMAEELLPKLFNSFNARITRSILIFEKMDLFHSLFGVGMNNTENYVNAYGIYTAYDEGNLTFGASLIASAVQYGIFGAIIFLCSLIALVYGTRHSKVGFLFALLYIIYTLFEEVIFNFRMAFLLSFVIYYIRLSQWNAVRPKIRADEGTIAMTQENAAALRHGAHGIR